MKQPYSLYSMIRKGTMYSIGLSMMLLCACSKEGVINKVKYNGKKITNTCDQFKQEVKGIVDANAGTSTLRVSEFDNSQFDYYFLEPGQFEQVKDTVYFRLINDLEYAKYLHKGVAIQISGSYGPQDHLKTMEKDPVGELGMQVIDKKYYDRHKDPFFLYRLPTGSKLDGKQLTLKFSVVKYDKKGKVKKVFCNSVEAPMGPLAPPCCTDQPWQNVHPKSIVQLPDLQVKEEKYKYKGFQGTLDLIFPMSSTKFNQKELRDVIVNYINRYESEGFNVKSVNIEGYASQGGKVDYNKDLSHRRSVAVQDELSQYYKNLGRDISFSADGKGEDWDRFELLVNTAPFTEEQRQELLQISQSSANQDEKEAQLRKLKYWKKLVDNVLTYCRHTLITFSLEYIPNKMYVENYKDVMPIIAPELYNVATKTHTIMKYQQGNDAKGGLSVLNTLIDENGNKTVNLYTMRSTYHIGLSDLKNAINDIESAFSMDKDNTELGIATLSYKTAYADNYGMEEKMRLLGDYNTYRARFPDNKIIQQNRAVMMEKVGFISGALAEYTKQITPGGRNAVLQNNRGVAKLKTNRITEAEVDFQEAIRSDAQLAEAYFNLAIVYAWKGLTAKAVENLDQAITLKPEYKCKIFPNPAFRYMKSNAKFRKYSCDGNHSE